MLARLGGEFAAKADLRHLFSEFLSGPFFEDRKLPVFCIEEISPLVKGLQKTTVFAVCEMSMKPPLPVILVPELAHVDVSRRIDFTHTQKCHIQTAAVIEIKLRKACS